MDFSMHRILLAGLIALGSIVPLAASAAVPAPGAITESWFVDRCGNGRLDWEEECDDGNADSGDACPSAPGDRCRYSSAGVLIHGNSKLRSVREAGCLMEWYVVNPAAPRDRQGMPSDRQVCRDQDPACDFDGEPGRCRFQVVACFNNADVNLPGCTPSGISGSRVVRPSPLHRGDPNPNFDALAHAIFHLHDPGDPQDHHESLPTRDPRDQNFCSAPFAIDVDLEGRHRRTEQLLVEVWDAGERPRRHKSRVRLTCEG